MSYGDIRIKSTSMFAKIEAGQPQIIRLLDASPVEIQEHSTEEGGQFKTSICSGNGCPDCKKSPPKQKFISNIYNQSLARVQLLKFGGSIAKEFQAIYKSLESQGADIMNVDLEISATGANLAKRYKVIPRMNSASLPPDLKKLDIKADLPF